MKRKIRLLTQTAAMLALLIVLQAFTQSFALPKPFDQLLTGSCVNAVLATAALGSGLWSGIAVAVFSPVAAYLLGIAPNILTVPAIMVGNTLFAVALALICGDFRPKWRVVCAWLFAALIKFAALYLIVVKIICGISAPSLTSSGALSEKMIAVLSVNFGAMQLLTALIGGGIALAIVPVIRKATHR